MLRILAAKVFTVIAWETVLESIALEDSRSVNLSRWESNFGSSLTSSHRFMAQLLHIKPSVSQDMPLGASASPRGVDAVRGADVWWVAIIVAWPGLRCV